MTTTPFAFIGCVSLVLLAAAPQQSTQQQETRQERIQERREERAAQQPGEGDADGGEEMNDVHGAKAQDGPYRSPYTLHFKYPMEQLLFDAKSERLLV